MTASLRPAPLALLAGLLLASGCAGPRPVPDRAPPEEAAAVDLTTGTGLSRDDALARLRQVRHLYVAEEHTNPMHHGVQLQVVRALHEAGVPVAVGIEWLPAPAQPTVDAFLAGDLDEEAFLEEVNWERRWGHDFAVYAPIFRWARDAGVPVRALNAPKGLARKVAQGGEDTLTAEEREALPPLDSGNAAHRGYFARMMAKVADAHGGHGELSEEALDRYYRAQLVWDEHMAREAARYLSSAEGAGRTLVVFAGRGHIERGLGIPLRVQEATGLPFVVVLPRARSEDALQSPAEPAPYPERPGDLLWLAPR